MSPVKTRPRWTPARSDSPGHASMISRAARNIPSASSPVLEGAPAVRYSLTAPTSMSDSSHVTPYVSEASSTAAATSSRRSRNPCGPRSARSSSEPASFRKATETCRCSASPLATERWSRSDGGTYSSSRSPATSGGGGTTLREGSSRRSRCAPARSSISQSPGTAAAISVLTQISDAPARSSSSNTLVAAGPATISSRNGRPVRKTSTTSQWTPADIRSSTSPLVLRAAPISSIVHCMSDAAPHARAAWASPTNSRSSASPRNFSTSPPWRSAASIKRAKIPEIVRTSSSAPSRPFSARRSESAVKPEMSTDTSDPSRLRARGASCSRLHPRTRRGRYGESSVRPAVRVSVISRQALHRLKQGLLPQEPLRTSCNARETGLVSGGEHGGCAVSRLCGGGVAGVHVVHRRRRRAHKKGANLSYRGLTCAGFAAVACAAPGVAQAHGGGHYVAGPATTPPTVDGTVGGSEWAGATPYTVAFGSFGNGTVRFLHTATDLYVGVIVQDATPGLTPSFDVFFDNDHDGIKDTGDDAWLSAVGFSGQDFFYSPTGTGGPSHYNDTVGGGSNQTVSAGTSPGDIVMFELKHPLCSADTTHDICTSLGQTLGVDFQYERSSPGGFVNAPGPDLFNPSNNWADLVLAANDVTPPTVSVTAPPAGSILRGTLDVAANASDNVGVTSVRFEYFDGASDTTTQLGTDTDPPYTTTFDTTTVPNTAVLNATIYAIARDAAGNETAGGNGITGDNTTPSRMVFESNRAGNSEIYSMSPDGTDVKRLTNNTVVDSRPSLSPDGTMIAWESDGNVWLMAIDGSNKQQLTSAGANGAPAFSPDGTKIAFESNRTEDVEIWAMNADGTLQTNLTNSPGTDVNPAWSPNGTTLAFDSDRAGNRDVFTMTADGSTQTNLTPDSEVLDSDPDWSPDGSKLLFVSGRGPTTSVWTMDAGGANPNNLTDAPIYDADPAWSPDGSHIVFTRDGGGQTFNLWTARADGTAKLRLTDAAGGQRNAFADWGSRVAETIATLEPVADTFVRASDPAAAHGTETTFDVYAGASVYCGRGPGPAYGLLRFDLSSLPAGVRVTDAHLDLTVDGGFAFDGDPAHYAIRLNENGWTESVTWNSRPADGIVPGPVGPPFGEPTINGTALSQSQDVLGIGNAFNANCDVSTGPDVRTFNAPQDRPQNFTRAVGEAVGTGSLSMEIWSQACGTVPATTVPCQNGQTEQAYYLRYFSREAADPAVRPKLVITYTSAVDLTSFNATPVGETPLGETVLTRAPLGETPLGETQISDLDNCTAIFVTCPTGGTINSNLGALRSDATLSDLVEALANPNAFTVAQLVAVLEPWSDFTLAQVAAIFTAASGKTLADLVASLPNPNDFTLNDLLIAVLRVGAKWEQIDLNQPALAAVATDGGTVALTATVTVSGSSVLTFTVNLPRGWTAIGTPSIEKVPAGAGPVLRAHGVLATPTGTRHILRTPFAVSGDLLFRFGARPGITLGPAAASFSVATAQGTTETAPPVSVNVQETFEPNNSPAEAQPIAPGAFYLSYLTGETDTDFFKVSVPATAGTRTTIRLSHLPKDYDLVVYGRQGTSDLVDPAASAAAPLETPVLEDSGAPVTHLTDALPAETLDDLRVLTDRPVLGVSAFRTTEDEAVVAVSDGVPGDYIVQVKGYNGASSVEP